MDTLKNLKTPDERSMDHAARVRHVLHGQHAPQSSIGWGRRALFQCRVCGRPWLMDGPRSQVDLDQAMLRQIAEELSADLADLPKAPCSTCAQAHAQFRIDRDEYVTPNGRLVGYGFNVEGDDPPGALFVVLVQHADELLRHLTCGLELRPHVPVHTDQERQTWAWLARLTPPPAADQYYRDRDPGDPNPPGHGAPGTTTWHWGGAVWITVCPPLEGPGLVHLALAIPPHGRVSVSGLVTVCRTIAQGVFDDPAFFE
jgi:hypothetical protein